MTRCVAFDVIGLPAPQGSKSAFVRGGRAVIVEGSSKSGRDKHAAWRAAVADGARKALVEAVDPFLGPTEVVMVFYLPLPASDPHRTLHTSVPDLDRDREVDVRRVGQCRSREGRQSLLADQRQEGLRENGQWCGVHVELTDSSEFESVAPRSLRVRLEPRERWPSAHQRVASTRSS